MVTNGDFQELYSIQKSEPDGGRGSIDENIKHCEIKTQTDILKNVTVINVDQSRSKVKATNNNNNNNNNNNS